MRKLKSLNIRDLGHLWHHLGCDRQEIYRFCANVDRHYHRGIIHRNGKTRPTAQPVGRFREVIDRLCALLQRVQLPETIQGGVKSKSPVTNATPHIHKPAVLGFDIKDFFPHVRPRMVYQSFLRLGCSPDVSGIMTRLVTLDGGLPQGSPTSTIVANLVIVPLALRIERLAKVHGSDYTQYIDDGTISGPGYLENLRPLIDRIIRQTGLQASPKPEKRLTKYSHQEQTVTGVRVNYRIDVPSKKVEGVRANLDKLDQELQLGRRLSRKQLVSMTGKIGHIGSLNRGSGRCLARRMARLSASILDHS